MNNRGEGRVWKLAEDFTVLLAVAVIVGTFSLLAAGGFIVPEDTHSGSAWSTRLPAPILRLGIRSVQLSSIKAIIGTRGCRVTLQRSIYRGRSEGAPA
jgi:hypothetical protein